MNQLSILKSNLILQGRKAEEFLSAFPVRRNDLRYSFYDAFGVLREDTASYFEVGDGRIFSANVIEEESDLTRASGWTADTLPRVSKVRIWKDEAAAQKEADEIRKRYNHVDEGHVLRHITKGKPNYPNEMEVWPIQISQFLDLPIDELDFSPGSLKLIDSQQKKLKIKQKDFEKHLMAPLLGYIGETARRQVGGQWLMIQAKRDPSVWEPVIVEPDGTHLSWFLAYADLINEDFKRFSAEAIFSLIS